MGETVLRDRAASAAERSRLRRATDSALSSGSLLAALATSSCCLIPFALFSLGIGRAWIGNLTVLEPFQPVFFAVAVAMIGLGVLRVRRRLRTAACRPGTPCADPRAARLTKAALWVASVLAITGMAFPWVFRIVAGA
ncbi:MAG: mercuric transporter MerT family protein [Rhodospirillales bacterium]|nr:mercuric transporter MerT family protein [Rhodospirillales bacterium]